MSFTLQGTGGTYLPSGNEEYSPNRIDTAEVFERGSAQSYLQIQDVTDGEPNREYAFTVFVKQRDEYDNTHLVFRAGKGIETDYAEATFHLKGGRVTTVNSYGDAIEPEASIISVGANWFACSLGWQYVHGGDIDVYMTVKDGDTGFLGNLGASRTNYSTEWEIDQLTPTGTAVLGDVDSDPFNSVTLANMAVLDAAGEQIIDGWTITKGSGADRDTIRFDEPLPSLPVTVVDLTTGSAATETNVTRSVFFWNPQLERRSLNDEPAYLGSAGSNDTILWVENVDGSEYPSSSRNLGYVFVPIFAPETDKITYQSADKGTVTIDIDQESSFSTRSAVRYVRIPATKSDGFPDAFTVHFNRPVDGETTRDFTITRDTIFSKRTPVMCSFVNKDGAIDSFWLNRRSTESTMVKHDTYYKNVVDYSDFSYNTREATTQLYNTVGRDSIVCNTSNLGEDINNYIKELRMSQYVWLTFDGKTVPVILKTLSEPYKTHVNDKLVQYTLKFDYANRVSNTIR